jgi:hypothetical protein
MSHLPARRSFLAGATAATAEPALQPAYGEEKDVAGLTITEVTMHSEQLLLSHCRLLDRNPAQQLEVAQQFAGTQHHAGQRIVRN